MNLSPFFTPSLYPGLLDRRSKIERSFLWQRKHKGQVIRVSLRTKDEQQALMRYIEISSVFIQLKNLGLNATAIRASLCSVRDKLVDNHFLNKLSHRGPQPVIAIPERKPQKVAEPEKVSPLLSATLTEWVLEMKRDWAVKTELLNHERVNHFIGWIGDRPIERVTKKNISEYKLCLDKKFKSPHTRQSALMSVSSLFNFAMNKRDYIQKNPVQGMFYKNVESINKKENISTNEHKQAVDGVKSDELKWLMRILWHTGMRIGEVVQLTENDYRLIDNVPCISINEDNGKTVKTSTSVRDVPIHQDLIDLGIMDLKPIFHWKTPGSAGDRVRLAFKAIGLKRSPHCYRYSMSDRLRDLGDIPDHVRYSILGHAHSTTTDRVYRNRQPILLMKKAIDRT